MLSRLHCFTSLITLPRYPITPLDWILITTAFIDTKDDTLLYIKSAHPLFTVAPHDCITITRINHLSYSQTRFENKGRRSTENRNQSFSERRETVETRQEESRDRGKPLAELPDMGLNRTRDSIQQRAEDTSMPPFLRYYILSVSYTSVRLASTFARNNRPMNIDSST